MICRFPIKHSSSYPAWIVSNLFRRLSPQKETLAANFCPRTKWLQIKKHQLMEETDERSKILTSSAATTSRMLTNDCEELIWTISSLVNRGIFSFLTKECNLAISRAHTKYTQTVPSGVLSTIEHVKNQSKFEEKTNTKCENSFSGNPQASSKISPKLSSFSSILFPEKNILFHNVCSTAVGLFDSRSNFLSRCKEIRNLQQRIFISHWLA